MNRVPCIGAHLHNKPTPPNDHFGVFTIDDDLWVVNDGELSDGPKIVEWINGKLKYEENEVLEFLEKPEVIMKRNATLACFIICFIIFVYLVYNILMYQIVWFMVAITVHIICTAGIMYGLINELPWFKYED